MSALPSPHPTVIKIGGAELDSESFLQNLVAAVQELRRGGEDVVVVHGGGKTIAHYQQALGLKPEFPGRLAGHHRGKPGTWSRW